MGPISHSDGHEAPWLASEFVPGLAAVIEQIVEALRKTRLDSQLSRMNSPDVLGQVELGTFGQERDHEREITRHDRAPPDMCHPA